MERTKGRRKLPSTTKTPQRLLPKTPKERSLESKTSLYRSNAENFSEHSTSTSTYPNPVVSSLKTDISVSTQHIKPSALLSASSTDVEKPETPESEIYVLKPKLTFERRSSLLHSNERVRISKYLGRPKKIVSWSEKRKNFRQNILNFLCTCKYKPSRSLKKDKKLISQLNIIRTPKKAFLTNKEKEEKTSDQEETGRNLTEVNETQNNSNQPATLTRNLNYKSTGAYPKVSTAKKISSSRRRYKNDSALTTQRILFDSTISDFPIFTSRQDFETYNSRINSNAQNSIEKERLLRRKSLIETFETLTVSTPIRSGFSGVYKSRSRSLDSQLSPSRTGTFNLCRSSLRFIDDTPDIRLRRLFFEKSTDSIDLILSRNILAPLDPYAEDQSTSRPERPINFGYNPRNGLPRSIYDSNFDLPGTSQAVRYDPMGRMNPLEDHERKVIIEFCHLLEKSKQLFNGLRALPQYGHKQWHSYYVRTFDVYTKLWKFQQQHRAILDSKYGLKRWQIGEIASKIGQLYYHFYLRTSDTGYLSEAFAFYYAIRGRCYYTKAVKEDKCELMVKKLRYYARFAVVSLLMKRIRLVRELIKELDRQIIDYGNTYDPDDQIEWTVVVDEVKAFIQAEPVVSVIHPDNYAVILSHRLSPLTTPPVERLSQMILSLQEILIIGSSSQQVKFSELTMDMFRMLQTLEREPTNDTHHLFDSPRQRYTSSPNVPMKGNLENGPRRARNPHKYLLFKPSPSQVLVYLSSGCNDLPPNGALLLYISADGHNIPPPKHLEDMGYDIGGLITTSKNDLYRESNKEPKPGDSKYKEIQCLFPGDIYPFTRKPLFIIIDSDNSCIFQNIPRHFGQPLVILMSPLEIPQAYHDRKHQGNLFTLFLHSPLTAICYICDIHTMSLVHWDRAQIYIDTFLAEASQLVTRSRIDVTYITFMGDDFLRLLLLRFIFCEVTLRLHRAFRTRSHLTRASPPIPEDLFEHPALVHIVMDLVAHLQVRSHFHDPSAGAPSSSQAPPPRPPEQ